MQTKTVQIKRFASAKQSRTVTNVDTSPPRRLPWKMVSPPQKPSLSSSDSCSGQSGKYRFSHRSSSSLSSTTHTICMLPYSLRLWVYVLLPVTASKCTNKPQKEKENPNCPASTSVLRTSKQQGQMGWHNSLTGPASCPVSSVTLASP